MAKRKIVFWANVDMPDDESRPLSLCTANLWREYADWLEQVGPSKIGAQGDVGLASGTVKWRALE